MKCHRPLNTATLVLYAFMLVVVSCCPAFGAESIYRLQKEMGDRFDTEKRSIEAQWDAMETSHREAWDRFKREVERKWQVFAASTRKEWVDYDGALDTRSRVDFEHGTIEIETVLPEDLSDRLEQIRKRILDRIQNIFRKQAGPDAPVLTGQVRDESGQAVTAKGVAGYFEKEVRPKITSDPAPFTAGDGTRRRRHSVTLKMVPEHVRIRAQRYTAQVKTLADRYGLDPALVMAVIHTESFFNPLAVSRAGAIGLMQVIPRFAGRDAYRYQYEKDWVIRPEYLYNPGINIELGTTYLHLLQTRHFSAVRSETKRRYLTICAYNWGPTAVRNKIVRKNPVDAMSDRELFALLRKKTPAETRDYLVKVTERTKMYAGYF